MRDADFKPGTTGSDLPEAVVHPESELLSPKARLESIASILALAVLRRRIRTTQPSSDREKDLIRVANRAFMRDKRVQDRSLGVAHE